MTAPRPGSSNTRSLFFPGSGGQKLTQDRADSSQGREGDPAPCSPGSDPLAVLGVPGLADAPPRLCLRRPVTPRVSRGPSPRRGTGAHPHPLRPRQLPVQTPRPRRVTFRGSRWVQVWGDTRPRRAPVSKRLPATVKTQQTQVCAPPLRSPESSKKGSVLRVRPGGRTRWPLLQGRRGGRTLILCSEHGTPQVISLCPSGWQTQSASGPRGWCSGSTRLAPHS